MKRMGRKLVKWIVMCLGMALVGILMVPAGVLTALILGIWKTTDRLVARLEQCERQN